MALLVQVFMNACPSFLRGVESLRHALVALILRLISSWRALHAIIFCVGALHGNHFLIGCLTQESFFVGCFPSVPSWCPGYALAVPWLWEPFLMSCLAWYDFPMPLMGTIFLWGALRRNLFIMACYAWKKFIPGCLAWEPFSHLLFVYLPLWCLVCTLAVPRFWSPASDKMACMVNFLRGCLA
jgi:hypothetical protein